MNIKQNVLRLRSRFAFSIIMIYLISLFRITNTWSKQRKAFQMDSVIKRFKALNHGDDYEE